MIFNSPGEFRDEKLAAEFVEMYREGQVGKATEKRMELHMFDDSSKLKRLALDIDFIMDGNHALQISYVPISIPDDLSDLSLVFI